MKKTFLIGILLALVASFVVGSNFNQWEFLGNPKHNSSSEVYRYYDSEFNIVVYFSSNNSGSIALSSIKVK